MVALKDEDVLDAFEVALEELDLGLREQADWQHWDPGYDVELREDLDGRYEGDRDINNLAAIEMAARAGLPVIGWRPALRNPGEEERVARAQRQFRMATSMLLDDYRTGRIRPEALATAISAAFIRQARNAFIAGKRSLGNLTPLTVADEMDIAKTARSVGLGGTKPDPRSFGGVLARLIKSESTTPSDIRDRLDRYIDVLMSRIMDMGFARAQQHQSEALDALYSAAASGRVDAYAAFLAARDSQASDLEDWRRQYERSRKEQAKAATRRERYQRDVDAAKKGLVAAIRRYQRVARKKMNRRLGILLRKVLDDRIDPADAAAELQAIIEQMSQRAYKDARRRAGGPSSRKPIEQDELDAIAAVTEDSEEEFLDVLPPITAIGVGYGAYKAAQGVDLQSLLTNILLDPLNLVDPDVLRWYDRRLQALGERFRNLSKMGEKAAFRIGPKAKTPAQLVGEPPVHTLAHTWGAEMPVPPHEATPMGSVTIVWWRLGDAQQHCPDCLRLSEMSPYKLDDFNALGLFPGSGHTECTTHCRCSLEFDVPDTICADTLFAESAAAPGDEVFFMEAEECENPIPIDAFATTQGLGYDTEDIVYLDDGQAFDWDADVAQNIELGGAQTFTLSTLPRKIAWLADQIPGEPPFLLPGYPIRSQTFAFGDSAYRALFQETGDSVRFLLGYMDSGAQVYHNEMAVAAMRWMAARASEAGKALDFDERLINSGMAKFLDDIGAITLPSPATMWDDVPPMGDWFKPVWPPKTGIPPTPFDGAEWVIPATGPIPSAQQVIDGSDIPLNIKPKAWSGDLPFEEPPLPDGVMARWQLDELRRKADEAWYTWEDVKDGKNAYALLAATERKAAKDAGLIVETIDGRIYATTSEQRMSALRTVLDQGVDPESDAFWLNVLGYDQARLDAIDAYSAARQSSASLRAGVIVVEPDGRVWAIAPRNQYAGYETTWSKGGVDAGETTAQAAVREAREELGFSVELEDYIGDFYNKEKTSMTRYYLARRTGGGPAYMTTPKEVYSLRLASPEDMLPVLRRYGKPDIRDTQVLDATLEILGEPPVGRAVRATQGVEEPFWDMYAVEQVVTQWTGAYYKDWAGGVNGWEAVFKVPGGSATMWFDASPNAEMSTFLGMDFHPQYSVTNINDERNAYLGALAGWLQAGELEEAGDFLDISTYARLIRVPDDDYLREGLEEVLRLSGNLAPGSYLDPGELRLLDSPEGLYEVLTTGSLSTLGAPTKSLTADAAGALATTLSPTDPLSPSLAKAAATDVAPKATSSLFGYDFDGFKQASNSLVSAKWETHHPLEVSGQKFVTTFTSGPNVTDSYYSFNWAVKEEGKDYIYVMSSGWGAGPTPSLAKRREYGLAALNVITEQFENYSKDAIQISDAFVVDTGLEDFLKAIGGEHIGYAWRIEPEAIARLRTAIWTDVFEVPLSKVPGAPLSHAAAATVSSPHVAHVAQKVTGPEPMAGAAEAAKSVVPPLATQYGVDPDAAYDVLMNKAWSTTDIGAQPGEVLATTVPISAKAGETAAGFKWHIDSMGWARWDGPWPGLQPDVLVNVTLTEQERLALLLGWLSEVRARGANVADFKGLRLVGSSVEQAPPGFKAMLMDFGTVESPTGVLVVYILDPDQLDTLLVRWSQELAAYVPPGMQKPTVSGATDAVTGAAALGVAPTPGTKLSDVLGYDHDDIVNGWGTKWFTGNGVGPEDFIEVGEYATDEVLRIRRLTPDNWYVDAMTVKGSVPSPDHLMAAAYIANGKASMYVSPPPAGWTFVFPTSLTSGAKPYQDFGDLLRQAGAVTQADGSLILDSSAMKRLVQAIEDDALPMPGPSAGVQVPSSMVLDSLGLSDEGLSLVTTSLFQQAPDTSAALGWRWDYPGKTQPFYANVKPWSGSQAGGDLTMRLNYFTNAVSPEERRALFTATVMYMDEAYPGAALYIHDDMLKTIVPSWDDEWAHAVTNLLQPATTGPAAEQMWRIDSSGISAFADDVKAALKLSPTGTPPEPGLVNTTLMQAAGLSFDDDYEQLLTATMSFHSDKGPLVAGSQKWYWPGPDGLVAAEMSVSVTAHTADAPAIWLMDVSGNSQAAEAKWATYAAIQQVAVTYPGEGTLFMLEPTLVSKLDQDTLDALKAVGMKSSNTGPYFDADALAKFKSQLDMELAAVSKPPASVPVGQMAGAPVAAPLAPATPGAATAVQPPDDMVLTPKTVDFDAVPGYVLADEYTLAGDTYGNLTVKHNPMKRAVYGTPGVSAADAFTSGKHAGIVEWRRLGNRLEVHNVVGADPGGAFVTHMRRMKAYMDDNPKVTSLTFFDNPDSGWWTKAQNIELNDLIGSVQPTMTKTGGYRLTREQVDTLVKVIDDDATKWAAWKAAPPPTATPAAVASPLAAISDAYDPALILAMEPVAEVDFKPGHLSHYKTAKGQTIKAAQYGGPGGLLIQWRHIGNRIEIHHLSVGATTGAQKASANRFLAHMRRMGDKAEALSSIHEMQFWFPEQLPQTWRDVLTAFGAKSKGGKLRMTKEQVVSLRDAIKADDLLPDGAVHTVAQAAPVSPEPAVAEAILTPEWEKSQVHTAWLGFGDKSAISYDLVNTPQGDAVGVITNVLSPGAIEAPHGVVGVEHWKGAIKAISQHDDIDFLVIDSALMKKYKGAKDGWKDAMEPLLKQHPGVKPLSSYPGLSKALLDADKVSHPAGAYVLSKGDIPDFLVTPLGGAVVPPALQEPFPMSGLGSTYGFSPSAVTAKLNASDVPLTMGSGYVLWVQNSISSNPITIPVVKATGTPVGKVAILADTEGFWNGLSDPAKKESLLAAIQKVDKAGLADDDGILVSQSLVEKAGLAGLFSDLHLDVDGMVDHGGSTFYHLSWNAPMGGTSGLEALGKALADDAIPTSLPESVVGVAVATPKVSVHDSVDKVTLMFDTASEPTGSLEYLTITQYEVGPLSPYFAKYGKGDAAAYTMVKASAAGSGSGTVDDVPKLHKAIAEAWKKWPDKPVFVSWQNLDPDLLAALSKLPTVEFYNDVPYLDPANKAAILAAIRGQPLPTPPAAPVAAAAPGPMLTPKKMVANTNELSIASFGVEPSDVAKYLHATDVADYVPGTSLTTPGTLTIKDKGTLYWVSDDPDKFTVLDWEPVAGVAPEESAAAFIAAVEHLYNPYHAGIATGAPMEGANLLFEHIVITPGALQNSGTENLFKALTGAPGITLVDNSIDIGEDALLGTNPAWHAKLMSGSLFAPGGIVPPPAPVAAVVTPPPAAVTPPPTAAAAAPTMASYGASKEVVQDAVSKLSIFQPGSLPSAANPLAGTLVLEDFGTLYFYDKGGLVEVVDWVPVDGISHQQNISGFMGATSLLFDPYISDNPLTGPMNVTFTSAKVSPKALKSALAEPLMDVLVDGSPSAVKAADGSAMLTKSAMVQWKKAAIEGVPLPGATAAVSTAPDLGSAALGGPLYDFTKLGYDGPVVGAAKNVTIEGSAYPNFTLLWDTAAPAPIKVTVVDKPDQFSNGFFYVQKPLTAQADVLTVEQHKAMAAWLYNVYPDMKGKPIVYSTVAGPDISAIKQYVPLAHPPKEMGAGVLHWMMSAEDADAFIKAKAPKVKVYSEVPKVLEVPGAPGKFVAEKQSATVSWLKAHGAAPSTGTYKGLADTLAADPKATAVMLQMTAADNPTAMVYFDGQFVSANQTLKDQLEAAGFAVSGMDQSAYITPDKVPQAVESLSLMGEMGDELAAAATAATPQPTPSVGKVALFTGDAADSLKLSIDTPPTVYGKGYTKTAKFFKSKHKLPQTYSFQYYDPPWSSFVQPSAVSFSLPEPQKYAALHHMAKTASDKGKGLHITQKWAETVGLGDDLAWWASKLDIKPDPHDVWKFSPAQAGQVAQDIANNLHYGVPPKLLWAPGTQTEHIVTKAAGLKPKQAWQWGDGVSGGMYTVSFGPKTYGLTTNTGEAAASSAKAVIVFPSQTTPNGYMVAQVSGGYSKPDQLGVLFAGISKAQDKIKASGLPLKVIHPSDDPVTHLLLQQLGGVEDVVGGTPVGNTVMFQPGKPLDDLIKAIDNGGVVTPASTLPPPSAATPPPAAPTPTPPPSAASQAATFTPPAAPPAATQTTTTTWAKPKKPEPAPPPPPTLWVPPKQSAADAHKATHSTVDIPPDKRLSTALGYDQEEKAMFTAIGWSEADLGEQTTNLIPRRVLGARWTSTNGEVIEVAYSKSPTGSLLAMTGLSTPKGIQPGGLQRREAAVYATLQDISKEVGDPANVSKRLYIGSDFYASRPELRQRLLDLGGKEYTGQVLDQAAVAADPTSESAIKVVWSSLTQTEPQELSAGTSGRGFWRAYGDGIMLEQDEAAKLGRALEADTLDETLLADFIAHPPPQPVLKALPPGVLESQPIRYMGLHPDHLYLGGNEVISANGLRGVSKWANEKVEAEWLRTPNILEWRSLSVARGEKVTDATARAAAVRHLDVMLEDLSLSPGVVLDVYEPAWADVPDLRDLLLRYDGREVRVGDRHFIRLNHQEAKRLYGDMVNEMAPGMPMGARTPVVDPVIWPNPNDLTEAAKEIGGQQRKVLFVDPDGNEWLFKPGATGRGAHADIAAMELARRLGIRTPPVRAYVLPYKGELRSGHLQRFVPDLRSLSKSDAIRTQLTPEQQRELVVHSVFDRLIANDDAHAQNFMLDPDGNLWGIDKTRSWKGMNLPNDTMDPSSLGQGGNAGLRPAVNKWWLEARDHPEMLESVAPADIGRILRYVDDITDEEFLRIMAPVLDDFSELSQFRTRDDFLRAVLDRKQNLKSDFERHFREQLRLIRERGRTLPKTWNEWLDGGGEFRLIRTMPEIQMERMAELSARFGDIDGDVGEAVRAIRNDPARYATGRYAVDPGKPDMSTQIEDILDRARQGSGGGVEGGRSVQQQGRRVHSFAYERARTEQNEAGYQFISDLNEWATLQALFNPKATVRGHEGLLDELRASYDPNTGTMLFRREVDEAWDIEAYYNAPRELRPLMSWAYTPDRPRSPASGLIMTARVRPEHVWLNSLWWPERFSYSRGEAEAMLQNVTKADVLRMDKSRHSWRDELGYRYDRTSMSEEAKRKRRELYARIHAYDGPVVHTRSAR